jgi:hypothetical protein
MNMSLDNNKIPVIAMVFILTQVRQISSGGGDFGRFLGVSVQ